MVIIVDLAHVSETVEVNEMNEQTSAVTGIKYMCIYVCMRIAYNLYVLIDLCDVENKNRNRKSKQWATTYTMLQYDVYGIHMGQQHFSHTLFPFCR